MKEEELAREQERETRSEAPPVVKTVIECQLKENLWDQSKKFVRIYLKGMASPAICSNEKIVVNYSGESSSRESVSEGEELP